MAKKNLVDASDALMHYWELSKYLFARTKELVYDVKEIPDNLPYAALAREIAEDLNIKWDKMTHDDSNRIMLAMLEDTYNRIAEFMPKGGKIILDAKVKAPENEKEKEN